MADIITELHISGFITPYWVGSGDDDDEGLITEEERLKNWKVIGLICKHLGETIAQKMNHILVFKIKLS